LTPASLPDPDQALPEPPADELVRAGLLERQGGRLLFPASLPQEAACQAGRPRWQRAAWCAGDELIQGHGRRGVCDRVVSGSEVGPSLAMTWNAVSPARAVRIQAGTAVRLSGPASVL